MSDQAIRSMRWGRNHRSPILIKHSHIKWLLLVAMSSIMLIFLSGYLLGFHQSETKVTTGSVSMPLAVPSLPQFAMEQLEPQLPEFMEPGEAIDVDVADIGPSEAVSVDAAILANSDSKPGTVNNAASVSDSMQPVFNQDINDKRLKFTTTVETAIVKMPLPSQSAKPVLAAEHKAASTRTISTSVPMGGPAPSDPGQSDRLSALRDDATEETAAYTLQIGTFGKLSNAERKLEEFRIHELSSYLTEFTNSSQTVLYNVRLGYYSGFKGAKEALAMYETEMAGRGGYVVRYKR